MSLCVLCKFESCCYLRFFSLPRVASCPNFFGWDLLGRVFELLSSSSSSSFVVPLNCV